MIKYLKFEACVLETYRRGLVNFDEAENKLYGYLKRMEDEGLLDFGRVTEEFKISIKKLLDISVELNRR